MFGFFAVDKPLGWTSHDVVAAVRRGLKVKRVGHAGTLDPLATGVLVVCFGPATRLSEYVMASEKVYRATIRLGIETATYDAEGDILAEADTSQLTAEQVTATVAFFNGEQDQIPPMYSAIKKDGKKLYDLARSGESIEREARRVTLQTRVLQMALPDVEVEIICTPGTYIRSIAHDLGAMLNVGGHLTALRRIRSGTIDAPTPWETLSQAMQRGDWAQFVLGERQTMASMPEIFVTDAQRTAILHGQSIPYTSGNPASTTCRAYAPDGTFIAILKSSGTDWLPAKVFGREDENES